MLDMQRGAAAVTEMHPNLLPRRFNRNLSGTTQHNTISHSQAASLGAVHRPTGSLAVAPNHWCFEAVRVVESKQRCTQRDDMQVD